MSPFVDNVVPESWNPILEYTRIHPSYNQLFINTISTLFYGSGSLKVATRHYIAIMAATRHRCQFLISLHEREFERNGGDVRWLRGIDHVTDRRLIALDKANMLLAHRPWLCDGQLVQALTTRQGSDSSWSLADLTQAIAICSQTHALSSFVHSLGNVEPSGLSRHEKGNEEYSSSRDKENTGQRGEVRELMERMSRLRNDTTTAIEANNIAHFVQLANEAAEEGIGGESPVTEGNSNAPAYSHHMSFSYVDFAKRGDGTKTFKIHEFSWDHGFNLINDICPAIAECLDVKFTLTQRLTYETMGQFKNVDTSVYRNAVWNYIMALFGIRFDDYDYAEVNVLLNKETKTFVKTSACYPARLTEALRNNVMVEFEPSEKVHVMLMIVEARLLSSMLYFTRALTNSQSAVPRHLD